MRRMIQTTRIQKSTRTAFTLVELLLAITISGLLVVSAVSAVRSLTSARESVDRRGQRLCQARQAIECVTSALRNIRRDVQGDDPVLVGRPGDRGEPGDRIDLLVIDQRRCRPEGPESDQQETSFSLATLPGREYPALLCRRDHALDDEPEDGGLATVVAEGIIDLSFEYYDGDQWQREWVEQPAPPRAVRVTVAAVADDSRLDRKPDVLTLSTVVAIGATRQPNPRGNP